MSKEIVKTDNTTLDKSVVLSLLQGDISGLSVDEKVKYYGQLCLSLGLNPATKPFQIIVFKDNKESLYALKDATDQLRKIHGVSVVESLQELKEEICIVRIRVQDSSGKFDVATGVVPLVEPIYEYKNGKRVATDKVRKLNALELANAIMKAETKAKRRATLSICGLGMLDESELDTIPEYKTKDIQGVIIENKTPVTQTPVTKKDKLDAVIVDELMNTLTVKEVKDVWDKYVSLQSDKVFIKAVTDAKQEVLIIEEYIEAKDEVTEKLLACTDMTALQLLLENIKASNIPTEYRDDLTIISKHCYYRIKAKEGI